MQFSPHWPARSAGVKLQSASASFPQNPLSRSLYYRTFLLGPVSTAFFPSSAHCSSRSSRTCSLPNSNAGIAVGSEALVWVACGSPPGNRMHYALRLLLNSSTPKLESAATETRRVMPLANSHYIDDPALSRRVNRVEVRDLLKRLKVEAIRTLQIANASQKTR